MGEQKVETLITAGGRVVCRRCQARSKRTGLQCAKPALRTSKTQKCQFHGGRSTGPKTAAGRQRCADAKLIHGRETRAKRQQASQTSALLKLYAAILDIPYRFETPK
jgi:hypothetical protein